jgi:hypothetical protein
MSFLAGLFLGLIVGVLGVMWLVVKFFDMTPKDEYLSEEDYKDIAG